VRRYDGKEDEKDSPDPTETEYEDVDWVQDVDH
jgi:hypothetical protein